MKSEHYDIIGPEVGAEDLRYRQSVEIIQAMRLFKTIVTPIYFKKEGDNEVIIFQIDLDIPNNPLVDIRGKEAIAIVTSDDDLKLPKVYSLRKDFPRNLIHTTLSDPSLPVDLCIFEEQFSELRHKWTGVMFLREIKKWLELTAVKELHKEDQLLEPFIQYNSILLHPPDLRSAVYVVKKKDNFYKLYTQQGLKFDGAQNATSHLPIFVSKTLVHTPLYASPANLTQLVDLLKLISVDIESKIETVIDNLIQQNISDDSRQKILATKGVMLCVELLLKRHESNEAEKISDYIFKIETPIGQIGEIGGKLEKNGNCYVKLIGNRLDLSSCTNIPVEVLAPIPDFLPKQAQLYNKPHKFQNSKFSLVGVGALGSHFLLNLTRQGFGIWNAFDIDILSPHNLTRHVLARHSIGENKAEAIANYINTQIYPHCSVVTSSSLNISQASNASTVKPLLLSSGAIIDISTSISIERHLVTEYPGIRKFSSFLNPSGNQLILLSEDKQRKQSLDLLEYQYYTELIDHKELTGHLSFEEKSKIRYARGCRDITSRISQDHISIFSGVLSKSFKANLLQKESKIEIWQLQEDCSVNKIEINPIKWDKKKKQGWTVYISATLLEKIKRHRSERLPNETGGILLGGVDKFYKKIYLTDSILSPKDSIEKPTLYIRGIEGVSEKLKNISKKTNDSIYYLGEWHSHPDGCSVNMSPDDKKQFAELLREGVYRGEPSLMLILGQRDHNLFFGNDKI